MVRQVRRVAVGWRSLGLGKAGKAARGGVSSGAVR